MDFKRAKELSIMKWEWLSENGRLKGMIVCRYSGNSKYGYSTYSVALRPDSYCEHGDSEIIINFGRKDPKEFISELEAVFKKHTNESFVVQ